VVEDEVDTLTRKNVTMTFVRMHSRTDVLIDRLQMVYSVRAHRGATFRVEDIAYLPPPPWGLERHGEETVVNDEISPVPDVTLDRMLSQAVTQSMSVYEATE
jgi:hypothetical protein